jgi:hypothetical protein
MIALLLALLLVTATGRTGEAVVTTLDGRTVKGEVTAWTAKELALKGGDGEAKLPVAELLDIRWSRDVPQAPAPLNVELIDGTRLAYARFTVAGGKATISGGHFSKPLVISRDLIRLVELQSTTPTITAALAELRQKAPAGDALVVAKRDGQSMDYLAGTLGDVTLEQAKFQWDGEKVDIKRTKIAAIVFYQPKARPLPDAVCELSLSDGSNVAAREIELKDDRVQVKTPAGVVLDLPVAEIERADFSSGKVVYLSDLKPTEVRWTPRVSVPSTAAAINEYGLPRTDISYTGSPLSLLWKDDVTRSRRDIRTYNKGLAVRSRTELTYRLPAGMKRFVTVAGIDPASAGQGNVMLTIRGDEGVLWEGPIDGKRAPVEIDVELKSAHRLQLLVDYGENLDYGDRLHLVEARITK